MQQFSDSQGLRYSAGSEEAVHGFEQLITTYFGFGRDTGDVLKSVLELDPQMPMALCTKGYFAKLMGSKQHSQRAEKTLKNLHTQINGARINGAQTNGYSAVNERERLHIAALDAWCAGELDEATRHWEAILVTHPLDGLALRLAHFTHFYSGRGRRMRDSVTRVLPRWPADHPHYGFVLGMHAFGLEECGQYAQAEAVGRKAVERNPQDAWSVHAVAHVFEMQEQTEAGIQWVTDLEPAWSKVNNFRYHLYWHRALFHLERGEFETVLMLYDDYVSSDLESDFYLDICNASSLLWRLEIYGVDVGERWKPIAEVALTHLQDEDLIFVSLHYLMALVSSPELEAAERNLAHMKAWAGKSTPQGKATALAGVALADAFFDLRSGNPRAAAEKIADVRYEIESIGGSHAQRDLFELMMLDASRQTDPALARSLLAERIHHKPAASWGWLHYSRTLEQCDAMSEAQAARSRVAPAFL